VRKSEKKEKKSVGCRLQKKKDLSWEKLREGQRLKRNVGKGGRSEKGGNQEANQGRGS